ncbi:MAG: bifunctional lysylphosphatidylglycerol flippase/synthetase MprF [Myxococcaceae bacterium]|nr:bifunctional lysylphosphatidylglycerol flippase/synthetase MprF [Myxococcaceae bacterium]MCI0672212.1 bifunctional lysylphosphatidylglycerol flippase/synthetase MprF [Myxococcaceae bacterium]
MLQATPEGTGSSRARPQHRLLRRLPFTLGMLHSPRHWRLPPLRALLPLLPLVLLGVAGWAVHRELRSVHLHDVARSVTLLPTGRVAWAVVVTATNFLVLTLYDLLALRHIGHPLPYRRVGPTAFTAYTFGHNLGMPALSGGSVRLRLYTAFGLSALEVAQVVAFCSLTFAVGGLAVGGASLLLAAEVLPRAWPLSPAAARALGGGLLLLAGGYVVLCARLHRRSLTLRGHTLRLPSARMALAQLAVSSMDWTLASLVLFLLLPPDVGLSLPAVLSLFLIAQVAGLASQVPGGLGVFDSVVVVSLAPHVPVPTVLGLLVVYRLIYYVGPFLVATVGLASSELMQRRRQLATLARGAHTVFAPVVPVIAAAACFGAGAVLLLSGALQVPAVHPSAPGRLLPLPLLELSHFLGSLVGVALLLLARGLYRRLDAAWVLALALLGVGAVLSLVRGFAYGQAALLLLLAALLTPFRAQFYRRAALLAEPLTAGWWAGVAAVVGAAVWLALFSSRHAGAPGELFWQFALHGDAPRALRASVRAVAAVGAAGVAQLLLPHVPRAVLPTAEVLAQVRPLVAQAPEAQAHLALVGDKALLLDEARTAFLMYAVEGRCWVSMGDPVGAEPAATELAWTLRRLADQHRGWAVFYEVGTAHLTRYLDMGLSLLKLGEEATVPLADFRLEQPERKALRHAFHRAEREGITFEVVPKEAVAALLPELEAISRAWLQERHAQEKGFSLGSFQPRYLQEGPVALVRHEGRPVGFANVWAPEVHEELSVDLMRCRPGAPHGTMELLFVSLMLWGRERGYARFNLGMAPFSGLQGREGLAPLWSRAGTFLYRHGEHFYDFQGLRQFKEKFHPVWSPRYLASPGGLALPRVLASLAALVSGGK